MNLALFDFDGTITDRDTFTDFIYHAADTGRIRLGKLMLAPVILAYKAGLLPASKAREKVAGFAFKGWTPADLREKGAAYAREILPGCLKRTAMERIRWHREQGDRIVLVSASLDVYLSFWCENHGMELICSKLAFRNGVATGRYNPRDCSGREKADRIRERYWLEDYPTIYAYGDTAEDREMLDLAHERYYRWKKI